MFFYSKRSSIPDLRSPIFASLLALLHTAHGNFLAGAAYQALKHLARTKLYSLGHAIGCHIGNNVAPANGSGQLLDEVLFNLLGIGVRLSVNILIDGAHGLAEIGLMNCLGKFLAGRLHQGRVERATHLQWPQTSH